MYKLGVSPALGAEITKSGVVSWVLSSMLDAPESVPVVMSIGLLGAEGAVRSIVIGNGGLTLPGTSPGCDKITAVTL